MDLTAKDTHIFQCSAAISPPDTVIEQVRLLKQQLRSAIGWYSSVNAWAHITFNEFQTDADTLSRWETYADRFARQQSPVTLRFNRTGAFHNNDKYAFFLAPDETSEQLLVAIMRAFHRQAPLSATYRSVKPHISVGRKLTADQLSVARTLIPEADIHFVCSDMALRRFNKARQQYDIYRRFPFEGIG